MKIWVLRPTVRCGSKVFGSAARPILASPVGAAATGAPALSPAAAAVRPRTRSASRRVIARGFSARGFSLDMNAPFGASGAGPPALDLDDDVTERLRSDVAQRVPEGALVPAHDRSRLHLDPIHGAVGVRALDQVALDDHCRVVEVVGVPPSGLARRKLDPPDPHAIVLVYQLGPDRVSFWIRRLVHHDSSRGVVARR